MISLVKMICFPGESEIPEDPASLDKMDIKLTRLEQQTLMGLNTEAGRIDYVRTCKLTRIHKIKAEKKRKAQIGQRRIQEYYEQRIKGKVNQLDVALSVTGDFIKYGERKGGIIRDIAKKFDTMVKKKQEEQ